MSNLHSFVFGPFQENTYIIASSNKECWIIDPGCYGDEERDKLQKFIADQGLKPVKLINTHGHLDHVFGNKFVADTYGLMPVIHPLEKEILAYAPVAGVMYDLPFDHYEGEVIYVEEGDALTLEELSFKVLLTPGHSPGSISLYSATEGILISGDVLFQGSMGRTDLPGGDHSTLIQSIRNKLFPLPEDTKVYSGHGPMTTIGFEKKNNPFLQ
jgi:hydroxyacylglutathione hydrolase